MDRSYNIQWALIEYDKCNAENVDCTEKVQAVLDVKNEIYFPAGVYHFANLLRVRSNTKIVGHNAVIKGPGFKIIDQENVRISGFVFEGTATTGSDPQAGIWLERSQNVDIESNTFIQTRIYCQNATNTDEYKNIFIRNNQFKGNYSGFKRCNVLQVDGFNQIRITDNTFECDGVTRFMKLSTGGSVKQNDGKPNFVENYNKNLFVSRNMITGSRRLSDNKQVIDFYAGNGEAIISDNIVMLPHETTGSTIFEGKNSGQEPQLTVTNKQKNIIISNNILIGASASYSIMYYGAYGTDFISEEKQCITISNNLIKNTHEGQNILEAIRIRGMHQVNINNNQINFTGDGNSIRAISVDGNKSTIVSGNVIEKGSIVSINNSQNTTSMTFTKPAEDLVIKGNVLNDWRYLGGVALVNGTFQNVVIEGNVLKSSRTETPASWAVRFYNAEVRQAIVVNNTSDAQDRSSRNGIRIDNGAVVDRLTDNLNSWNRKRVEGTTAPTAGKWSRGDIVYNTQPSEGNYAGWICVASNGTDVGTWRGFGLIEHNE